MSEPVGKQRKPWRCSSSIRLKVGGESTLGERNWSSSGQTVMNICSVKQPLSRKKIKQSLALGATQSMGRHPQGWKKGSRV